jgi:hypothetical protein
MMHALPRTTLQLEDDAMKAAKAHATRHRLVRQASDRPLVTEERNGLRILRLTRRSPKVTAELVDRLREDLP